mgnify:FL=1
MFIKIHKSYRNVVAICDSELMGKRFEEGKFQLDVKENFYKGDKVSEDEAIEKMQFMLREDATFNIVGQKSVNTAIKAEIISEDSIREIAGIPFAMILG